MAKTTQASTKRKAKRKPKPITLQDIFDAAWNAFIIEKKPPCVCNVGLNECVCVYANSNGDRCAIGLVLPDHVIESDYCKSHKGFGDIVEAFSDLFHSEITSKSKSELNFIQKCLHDEMVERGYVGESNRGWCLPSHAMRTYYTLFAQRYYLQIPGSKQERAPPITTFIKEPVYVS